MKKKPVTIDALKAEIGDLASSLPLKKKRRISPWAWWRQQRAMKRRMDEMARELYRRPKEMIR